MESFWDAVWVMAALAGLSFIIGMAVLVWMDIADRL